MRPRLLVLAQCLPYPPRSGVRSRTFNILKQLAREYDVRLIAFWRRTHQPTPADREAARGGLQRIVAAVAPPVSIPSEASALRRLWDHLRSLVTGRPYTAYEYRSGDFQRQLRDSVGRERPDLVHLDSVDLHDSVAELPPVPIACTHHDIEPLLLRLRAERTSPVLRGYLRHQARLIERLMRDFCPRLDLNVMMSPVDAERLRAMAPGSKTCVAPNGVDADYFRPDPGRRPDDGRIVFLGPTYQFANRDAVRFLLEEIFPSIRAARRAASLTLVGAHRPADAARFGAVPAVTLAGDVPDVRPYLAGAACSVVPIRVGGGTRLKILDAWAMGQAVVSTAVGCEGLEAVDGENILIRDTPQAFADAVTAVLDDSALRARLGAAARATVEARYAWSRIGESLRDAYRGIMRD